MLQEWKEQKDMQLFSTTAVSCAHLTPFEPVSSFRFIGRALVSCFLFECTIMSIWVPVEEGELPTSETVQLARS